MTNKEQINDTIYTLENMKNNCDQYTLEQIEAINFSLHNLRKAIASIEALAKIENIVCQAESLHPEIAIGDREAIRKIREELDNDTSTEKS